jgi:hypothetical protein
VNFQSFNGKIKRKELKKEYERKARKLSRIMKGSAIRKLESCSLP